MHIFYMLELEQPQAGDRKIFFHEMFTLGCWTIWTPWNKCIFEKAPPNKKKTEGKDRY